MTRNSAVARASEPVPVSPAAIERPLQLVAAESPSAALATRRPRVQAVDALRGLIMIIMALDHDRDFIHAGAQSFSPEDLSKTSAILFFTRWVTHICAPVFMFTAGIGAYLWLQRGRTKRQLATYLISRGIWLLLLEVTVVHLAMTFNFSMDVLVLEVIWALGWCMILLAGLAYLPTAALAGLSIALILLHNLANGVDPSSFGRLSWLWMWLHQPGPLVTGPHTVILAYPIIPWIAVMSAGFCFGRVLQLDQPMRRKLMIRLGIGLSLGFVAIRLLNVYGDPFAWTVQRTRLFTVLSFLRATKYPPSLAFLLMTMGPALLLLAWFDGRRFTRGSPLVVFGRVPLFFFIVHLYLLHAVSVVLMYARYGDASFLFATLPALGGPRADFPQDLGVSLPIVYLVWVGALLLLYPLCRWFGSLKQRRDDWWLSYL